MKKFGVEIKWKVGSHDDICFLFCIKWINSCTIIFPLHREWELGIALINDTKRGIFVFYFLIDLPNIFSSAYLHEFLYPEIAYTVNFVRYVCGGDQKKAFRGL